MLHLIGAGLSPKGITIEAIDLCKNSNFVYVDMYTSFISDAKIEFIKEQIGKNVVGLYRQDMEEKASKIVDQAVNNEVCVLVGGDPLMATTHKTIFLEAKKKGVKISISHSGSILNAVIGESGLDFYKFGQITTLPNWSEHYKPMSFYNIISNNIKNNLHTILLFDYDWKSGNSVSVKEAIGILKKAESEFGKGIIRDDTFVIIMNNLSQEKESKYYITIEKAEKIDTKGLTTMVIPASLSEIEKELIGSIY
jgi:diphthine synthase